MVRSPAVLSFEYVPDNVFLNDLVSCPRWAPLVVSVRFERGLGVPATWCRALGWLIDPGCLACPWLAHPGVVLARWPVPLVVPSGLAESFWPSVGPVI